MGEQALMTEAETDGQQNHIQNVRGLSSAPLR